MKYLVDSNVWLERLLNWSSSDEVKEFLEVVPSNHLCISIGIILYKFREVKVYSVFIEDLFNNGAINLLTLSSNQLKNISEISVMYNLDFDDSYQWKEIFYHRVSQRKSQSFAENINSYFIIMVFTSKVKTLWNSVKTLCETLR